VDNTRSGSVDFIAIADGLVHGIAGYFESRLYKDIQLSASPPGRLLSCV